MPKEKEYKDRTIELSRNNIKLSELSKEERDIFFAGWGIGWKEAANATGFAILQVIFIIIFILFIIK